LLPGSTILADSRLTSAENLDTTVAGVCHVRGLALKAVSPALATQADRYRCPAAAFAESGRPGDRDNALGIDRILGGLGVLIAACTR
jgi:hypothetical protein